MAGEWRGMCELALKMCLNETYRKVQISKHLSDMFPVMNGWKQGDALLLLRVNFALDYAIGGFR
jgi:hypothetical protein